MIVKFSQEDRRIYCNGKFVAHAVTRADAKLMVTALNAGVQKQRMKEAFAERATKGTYRGPDYISGLRPQ